MTWRHAYIKQIKDAFIDHINQQHIALHPAGEVIIEETRKEGAGKIRFVTASNSLKLTPYNDNNPIKWLLDEKCADGAIIVQEGSKFCVHVVELKSKLSPSKLSDVRRQAQSMLANALAAMGALRLPTPNSVVFHIACTNEDITHRVRANPIYYKIKLGVSPKDQIDIPSLAYHFTTGHMPVMDGLRIPVNVVIRDNEGNATVDIT